MRPFLVLSVVLLLPACAMPLLRAAPDAARIEAPPTVTENPDAGVTRPLARPPADAGSAGSDTAVALPPVAAADGFLGDTLAGLGSPSEAGLWLSTGLVADNVPGRVVAANGATLDVELRASGAAPSAGSQLSLQAMQALGLPLGQLAPLRVYRR